ncbi:hypothetical protein [uncultured Helicobacter sp.]|uniref:hypothetical protein n=1 Tax=uncultured Helicobacter sp. TaxID=175537 RepID=UPI00374F8708
MLVNVRLDSDILLDMLVDRLDYWTSLDKEDKKLFKEMYRQSIEGGVFNNDMEFNVMQIVDNDVVNWCSILYKDELSKKDFNKLKKLYDNRERDVSCESFDYGNIAFIEAVGDDKILVRW